jgi:hypothetical protein
MHKDYVIFSPSGAFDILLQVLIASFSIFLRTSHVLIFIRLQRKLWILRCRYCEEKRIIQSSRRKRIREAREHCTSAHLHWCQRKDGRW